MLKHTIFSISSSFCSLFNLFLSTGTVPKDWKISNITPVLKSGNKCLFLDLSKAFDKVPHRQLPSSLSDVGVSGPLLSWFDSYLSGRFQQVVISGYSSTPLPVLSGVPQGSILGPLLFIIYVNSLANLHLTPGSSLILYADDILLYRPLCSADDNSILQHDVDSICDWISSAGLSLNLAKSTLIVISRMRSKPTLSILINSTAVSVSDSVKYLGVTITSDLSWNRHVSNICLSARKKLGLLYRTVHLCDQQSLSRLYKALVLPKLDYCCCVWDPSTSVLVNRLESVNKFAAKICTKRWSGPSSLFHLGWSDLSTRRKIQKLMIYRRILHNYSIIPPTAYFSSPPKSATRSSILKHAPFARTKSFQLSFFVSVCHLWNHLPLPITLLSSTR